MSGYSPSYNLAGNLGSFPASRNANSSASMRPPIAVLALAFRKSMRGRRSGCVLPVALLPAVLSSAGSFGGFFPSPGTSLRMHPVGPCRMRSCFNPRMRMNRFVFLDLSTLSLENPLGVTVSPQFPLSAGYIAPSAGEGSLPPRLIPAAARAAPFPCVSSCPGPDLFFSFLV